MDEKMDIHMDIQMKGWTNRWTHRQMDEQMDRHGVAKQLHGPVAGPAPTNSESFLPVLLVEDSMAVFQKLLSKGEADSEARGVFQILDPEPSHAEQ